MRETLGLRLKRATFLSVTGLEGAQLRTQAQRRQLPFEVDQTVSGRGYSLCEAALVALVQEFAEGHGIGLGRAADVVGALPPVLTQHWPDIGRAVQRDIDGLDPVGDEILCGRASFPYPHQPVAVCGTLPVIRDNLRDAGLRSARLILSSATLVMASFSASAHRNGFEIPAEFWTAPLDYRPRPVLASPADLFAPEAPTETVEVPHD